jgi:hypothetical protein
MRKGIGLEITDQGTTKVMSLKMPMTATMRSKKRRKRR